MKRFLLLGLALLLLGSAVFADDAKVMPLRTGRLSLAPSFTMGDKSFSGDGIRGSNETLLGSGAIKAFNFGAALEYGITSWLTGAIQWAPGINAWSDVDTMVPYIGSTGLEYSTSEVRALDVGDLFVGAKMQILGKDGLSKNDNVRIALAPGIKIPFGGPKFDDQYANAKNGDKVTAGTMDNHSLGLGLRSYIDFVINDKFFINFYNEALMYATKRDFKKAGYTEYLISDALDQMNDFYTLLGNTGKLFEYGKVSYGYELTFEIEPVFSTPIGPVLFTASMPLTLKTTPGKKYDFTYDIADVVAFATDPVVVGAGQTTAVYTALGMVQGLEERKPTNSFSINPGVAFMFYKWKVPFEFEFNYKAPIWGENTGANHSFIFVAKMFFKF